MKLGFIGAGNMASAIVRGLVGSAQVTPDQIVLFDPRADAVTDLVKDLGVGQAGSNTALVTAAEVVVLAVKPQVLPNVVSEIAGPLMSANRLVVSIAAGTPLAKLEDWLSPTTAIVRVMPNVNLAVGQGMAAVAGNAAVSRQQIDQVMALFAAVGQVIELDEGLFAAYSALAGASPAWTFYYIDALARAGVAHGLPKAQALMIATQAVRGSAALVAATGTHPWQLIDQVCSPAGTTIAGLAALEDRAVAAAIGQAVSASISRDRQIAQDQG